ncbi:MAG: ChaN family lipoprotein [Pseudomonadota bacterium]
MSSSIRAFMKQLPLRRCAVCLLSLAGCIAPTTPAYAAEKVCVPVGAWVAPQYEGGGTLVIPRLMAQLARRQVVLLGETHDSFEDHRWQLQTIAALHAQRPDMVLGLEMFPRRVQAVLDRWVAGELTEQEFLKQSEWRKVWNYDPDLYLPIFHFARMNRVPMLALNVERSLTALVREKGWDAVPVEKREGVTTPAPADQAYLDELAQVFRMHAGPDKADETFDFNDPDFRRFVAGQQTWDRAMAQAISTAVSRPGAPLVVGIMGAGHVMYRYGVPRQLEDLGVADSAVLLTWDRARGCDALTPRIAKSANGPSVARGPRLVPIAETANGPSVARGPRLVPIADAVFGTDAPEETAPQKPRLGLLLEEGKDGVTVINVAENSIAEAAGIQARDVLIEVAGLNVKNPAQVSEIVQRQAPGTWLPITLKREQHTFEIVAKFPVQK